MKVQVKIFCEIFMPAKFQEILRHYLSLYLLTCEHLLQLTIAAGVVLGFFVFF